MVLAMKNLVNGLNSRMDTTEIYLNELEALRIGIFENCSTKNPKKII